MTMLRIARGLVLLMPLWGASLGAQDAPAMAIRTLRVMAQSDSAVLRSVAAVRSLPDGSVLVNDVNYRRVVVLDSSLRSMRAIADTTTLLPFGYGLKAKPTGLIAWSADSSLFADSDRSAVLVLNSRGEVVRIAAPVRNGDLANMVGGAFGTPAADGRGSLLYATETPFDPYTNLPVVGGAPVNVTYPDSNPIVRANFDTRTVDTVAHLRAPVRKVVLTRESSGSVTVSAAVNPLPQSDDWTVLPDGTIAIVRARDYHIDWIAPDGVRSASPSMPFDWRSISPAEKRAMVDSVKRGMDAARAREVVQPGAAPTPALNVTVDPSDIPDSYPPLRVGQTRADMDGRVWILPSTSGSAQGGLLYDVADRLGKIVERGQLPPGRALAGFGRAGTVFVYRQAGGGTVVLERSQIVR
ncbi:MAG: hypothetical protein ACO1Q7_01290 [Gemmatimonas sp.]